jgi:transposase InsO family protein
MTDKSEKDISQTSPEALFRYLVVSKVLARAADGLSMPQAMRAVAEEAHMTLAGSWRRVSVRTLYRWLAAYRQHGLPDLEPKTRETSEGSTVLAPDFLAFAADQKDQDPRASIPEIIRRARELGILEPLQHVDRTTVYRALQRKGVSVKRRRGAAERDARRFAYPHRLQMVLADGKHFRAGVNRAKRVALFFLDDATRLGLDVIVGTAESGLLFLTGLFNMVRRHGLMRILYLDHGPGFFNHDTIEVVGRLKALLIFGEKAYPEGHGKIERLNQTVNNAVLRHLDRRPDVDPGLGPLTLRLRHWLRTTYNHTPHEALGMETPSDRFHRDPLPLRFPESQQDLENRFVVFEKRSVSNDNTISFESVLHDMPRGHARERIVIHRRVLDGTLHVIHKGRLVQIHPTDLAANAQVHRARSRPQPETENVLPPSAAELAFDHDYGPIVNKDGGFSEPPHFTGEKTP